MLEHPPAKTVYSYIHKLMACVFFTWTLNMLNYIEKVEKISSGTENNLVI